MTQTAARWHWTEYIIEAAGLGAFMVSAAVVTTVLEYPGSPLRHALPDAALRRILTGVAMGLTAVAIIYSPWGKRSGAHINPSVTLAFLRLGKIEPRDAVGYIVAQFIGGFLGTAVMAWTLGRPFREAPVMSVVTVPGPAGAGVAFAAEVLLAAIMMGTILTVTNTPRWARFGGLAAGILVASFIAVEGPLSGMSINPARTFGPALESHLWRGLWLYLLAPPLGMLAAAEAFRLFRGRAAVRCAKLVHDPTQPCIFRCGYREAAATARPRSADAAIPEVVR